MKMTGDVCNAFDTVKAVLKTEPKRVVSMEWSLVDRFVAASDAAQEECRMRRLLASAPLLQRRIGREVEMRSCLYRCRRVRHTYIAQLELYTIAAGLLLDGQHLCSRPGVWFVDNVAGLMALIKDSSTDRDLNRMAGVIHDILYVDRAPLYFEWIESGANWSDGISRYGFKDRWHMKHGFSSTHCCAPEILLTLPVVPIDLFRCRKHYTNKHSPAPLVTTVRTLGALIALGSALG